MKKMFGKIVSVVLIMQASMKAFSFGGGKNSKIYLQECGLYLKPIDISSFPLV